MTHSDARPYRVGCSGDGRAQYRLARIKAQRRYPQMNKDSPRVFDFAFEVKGLIMNSAEEIYQVYPRHVGKREAIKAIERALFRLSRELRGVGCETPTKWLKDQTAKFAQSPAGNRGIYTPHPATWFNQSRYLDDPAEWEVMTEKEEETVRRYREANVGVWRPS